MSGCMVWIALAGAAADTKSFFARTFCRLYPADEHGKLLSLLRTLVLLRKDSSC